MTFFWWVNESKTWDRAVETKSAWAPLLNKNGKPVPHWAAMDEVVPGDIVVHYVRGQVRAISRALSTSGRRLNPYGTQPWSADGRDLNLTYEELDVTIPLNEIPVAMRQGAGAGSPFDRRGEVNQGYFYRLDPKIALFLLERAGRVDSADSPLEEAAASPAAGNATGLETRLRVGADGTVTTTTRPEHRELSRMLFGSNAELDCALCGLRLPRSMLVTAHIKPRSRASLAERGDPNIVMAACQLGCDALFERGLIVVDREGTIQAGKRVPVGALREAIERVSGRPVEIHGPHNAQYFAWHRNRKR